MKNQNTALALFLVNLLLIVSCSKNKNVSAKPPLFHEGVETYISSLMTAEEIPGMAVAVIKNGQIIHKKSYGLANIAHKVPVTDSTLFRMYSTSKLITAVAIFQLIEDKRILLSDVISKYIDNLPEHWKMIKMENLLTHSSGLPEYTKKDKKLSDKLLFAELAKEPLHFENGDTFEYNQTNFWLLQLIIEKLTNQKFENFIKNKQFKNTKDQVIFASNSLVAIPNRVAKYQFNKEYNAYEMSTYEAGERSLAGNGLNTSLNALLEWNMKLDNNELIQDETKLKMMSLYNYKSQTNPFGYGWGVYGPEEKRYYGFAGGGVCALMKFIDKDLTIIILSNGFKNRPIISNVINYISGLLDPSLARKDRMLNEEVRLAFILKKFNVGVALYNEIKQKNKGINFERAFNFSGYHFMANNQITKAISIFKLYTEEYPNSSNAFDSLGEGYFKNKQYDLAKKNYKKSLELNSKNEHAKKMLGKIKELNN